MKHRILLKSFLLLMFILASSSFVYASSDTTFSTDGTAFGPSFNLLAQSSETDAIPIATVPIIATTPNASSQVATALSGFGSFSFNSWFWIIFLLLLLFVTLVYIYSHPPKKNRVEKI